MTHSETVARHDLVARVRQAWAEVLDTTEDAVPTEVNFFDAGGHSLALATVAARLSAALDAVSREQVDLAILDVNVAGEPIYPVAEALAQRSIPFVFSTGYGSAGIRDTFRDRPVLQKPFAQHDLKQKLLAAWRHGASA